MAPASTCRQDNLINFPELFFPPKPPFPGKFSLSGFAISFSLRREISCSHFSPVIVQISSHLSDVPYLLAQILHRRGFAGETFLSTHEINGELLKGGDNKSVFIYRGLIYFESGGTKGIWVDYPSGYTHAPVLGPGQSPRVCKTKLSSCVTEESPTIKTPEPNLLN